MHSQAAYEDSVPASVPAPAMSRIVSAYPDLWSRSNKTRLCITELSMAVAHDASRHIFRQLAHANTSIKHSRCIITHSDCAMYISTIACIDHIMHYHLLRLAPKNVYILCSNFMYSSIKFVKLGCNCYDFVGGIISIRIWKCTGFKDRTWKSTFVVSYTARFSHQDTLNNRYKNLFQLYFSKSWQNTIHSHSSNLLTAINNGYVSFTDHSLQLCTH